jgi:hypothetical protein
LFGALGLKFAIFWGFGLSILGGFFFIVYHLSLGVCG